MVLIAVILALLLVNPFESTVEAKKPGAGKWEITVDVTDQFDEKVSGQEVVVIDNLGETVFIGHTNPSGKVNTKLEQGQYQILVQGQTFLIDLNEDHEIEATITVDLPIAPGF